MGYDRQIERIKQTAADVADAFIRGDGGVKLFMDACEELNTRESYALCRLADLYTGVKQGEIPKHDAVSRQRLILKELREGE